MYTDTDSLLLEIKTDDINKDIYKYLPDRASTLFKRQQKYVGKRNDELPYHSRVCVSETENVLHLDKKGVKKNVAKKQILHEQWKETLFGTKQLWHGMNILRSEGQEIYGIHVNKISLSPFDFKAMIHQNANMTNR